MATSHIIDRGAVRPSPYLYERNQFCASRLEYIILISLSSEYSSYNPQTEGSLLSVAQKIKDYAIY